MSWEALIWCCLAALSPAAMAAIWPRWKPRLGDAAQPLEQLAPWLHGLGPAYLALITGAILSRDAGLRGHDRVAWLAGAAAAVLILGGVLALVRRPAAQLPWPDPLQSLCDEPRWTLYRAAGALWFGSHALGVAAGLGWAVLEWALTHRSRLRQVRQHPEAAEALLRLASSALIFLATRNFWLTCLSGWALLAVLGRQSARLVPEGTMSPDTGGKGHGTRDAV
jgi:hypothetical protein